MTIKKALGIGLLGASIIGLLAIGIKTNSFNKENLKPKTLTRSNTPIQVNAEKIDQQKELEEKKEEQKELEEKVDPQKELDENIEISNTKAVTETTYWTQSIYNTYISYKSGGQIYIPNQIALSYINDGQYKYKITGKFFILNTYNNSIYRLFSDQDRSQFTVNVYTNEITTQPDFTKPIKLASINILISEVGSIYNLIIQFRISQNNNGQTFDTFFSHRAYIYDNNYNIITDTNVKNSFTTTNTYLTWITNTVVPPTITNDVIDIRSLMLQILTMPFTFITQAFDVTLWPNTEYEFNIGNFIMAIISIASILFIIKLFTSGFSIIGNYTNSRIDGNLKKSQTKLNKAKTKEIESKTPKKE